MSETEQLRIALQELNKTLLRMRDSFANPVLSGSGSAELMAHIAALVDAKMAVREREIINAMRAMFEAADAKP